MLREMEALVQLLALVLTALTLIPAAAHVLELPNKLPLSRDQYLAVQQVYRGWNRVGFIVIPAIVMTLWLTLTVDGAAEAPAFLAFMAMLLAQVVFWMVTFPVNRRTHDWTEAPEGWEHLRDRWEISHAISALLNFIALVCVAAAVARS
jgi:hypothetical protein